MDEEIIKRVPPHSVEAEQSVLTAMLGDSEAIIVASEILTGDDFYNRQYGIIFETIVELFNKGEQVDPILVQQKLKEKDVAPETAELGFIRELALGFITSTNTRQYAQIVHDKALMRKIIKINDEVSTSCYQGKDELDYIMEKMEGSVFELVKSRTGGDYVPVRQIVLNVINKIEAASKNDKDVTGIPTGFIEVDRRLSGLQPSDLVLIAARPSMGKTAFVLNVAHHIAVRENQCCAIFSLEMSSEQLMNRMMALDSNVDSQHIRNGNLTDDEWSRLFESAGNLSTSNLVIDDTPGISISELRSKCRKLKLEKDLKVVMIDYLQLMSGSGKGGESRQQEISDISRSLKALAREIECPVIALSQLSRACESRPDHRPMLSDLRESGAIEQDADVVMFLYRDDYYHQDSPDKGLAEVITAKQRNGPTGTDKLVWLASLTKFANRDTRDTMK